MFINGEQAGEVRAAAVKLVAGVLDFHRGDPTYQEVCKGYSPGFGTSCTFLPHWMLLMLGVSARNRSRGQGLHPRGLINRNDAVRGTKLMPGDGVVSLAQSPAFVPFSAKVAPSPGDIVVIQSDPVDQSHEHVFVFLNQVSTSVWDTGESGQARSKAANGALEGKRKNRPMRIEANRMVALPGDDQPTRYVQGWLDISKLDYDFLPS